MLTPCLLCVVRRPTLGRSVSAPPPSGLPIMAPLLAPTFAPHALSLSAHYVPLALIFLDLSPLSRHVLAPELGGNSGFPGFNPGQPLEYRVSWLRAFRCGDVCSTQHCRRRGFRGSVCNLIRDGILTPQVCLCPCWHFEQNRSFQSLPQVTRDLRTWFPVHLPPLLHLRARASVSPPSEGSR